MSKPYRKRKRAPNRWRQAGVSALLTCAGLALCLAAGFFAGEEAGKSAAYAVLYPLLGGCGVYGATALVFPDACESEFYQTFVRLYGIGLAILFFGRLSQAVLGEGSRLATYIRMADIAGWMVAAAGLIVLALAVKERYEYGEQEGQRGRGLFHHKHEGEQK